MSGYADAFSLPMDELLALGRIDHGNSQEPFNMAYLAVRGSGAVKGGQSVAWRRQPKHFLSPFSPTSLT